jgi:hypothetical protein
MDNACINACGNAIIDPCLLFILNKNDFISLIKDISYSKECFFFSQHHLLI